MLDLLDVRDRLGALQVATKRGVARERLDLGGQGAWVRVRRRDWNACRRAHLHGTRWALENGPVDEAGARRTSHARDRVPTSPSALAGNIARPESLLSLYLERQTERGPLRSG